MLSQDNVGTQDGFYGTYTTTSEGDEIFHPVGKDFWIESISVEIESQTVLLHFATSYGGKVVRVKLSRSEMDLLGIKKLMGVGFDIKTASQEIFQLLVSIKEQEYFKKRTAKLSHINVGWQILDKENNICGIENNLNAAYKWHGHIGKKKSAYQGNLDIKPRGTYEAQKAFIKDEVQNYIPLVAAVAIGLSAVVNGLIGDIVKTPNLIVHLMGDSSIGKTTALQLAISVAGIPDLQNMSLMFSWNATFNALIFRLKGNHGMPIGLDELSKYMGSDFDRLLYTLSDGRDKDRMNKDVTIRNVDVNDLFHTTIISTGECSWLGKCKTNNTGLKARIIEINKQFTESAEQADKIKQGVFENCGWLAPALAEHIESKGIDYVVSRHRYWTEKYMSITTANKLKERISANIAHILTAAELANEAFDFSFDLNALIDFFVSNEAEAERDIADIAYEKLLDFAKANRSHFNIFTHGKGSNQTHSVNGNANPTYGRLDSGIDRVYDERKKIVGEVSYSAAYFPSIVHKLGFEDEKIILKKLKEAGYLNHEREKTYRRRKLNQDDATSSKMYVLYEFEETAEQSLNDTFTEVDDDENPFSEQGKSPLQ